MSLISKEGVKNSLKFALTVEKMLFYCAEIRAKIDLF